MITRGTYAVEASRTETRSRELESENERLKKLIGELTIANDSLKKAMEGGRRR